MNAALLSIDLQDGFSGCGGVVSAAAADRAAAAGLLVGRAAGGVTVIHTDHRRSMPRRTTACRTGRRGAAGECEAGTPGHAAPPALRPPPASAVVQSRFFCAIRLGRSSRRALAVARADTLIVAGVHLHGCVRTTVLDAYGAAGLTVVWVADDAVGQRRPAPRGGDAAVLDGRGEVRDHGPPGRPVQYCPGPAFETAAARVMLHRSASGVASASAGRDRTADPAAAVRQAAEAARRELPSEAGRVRMSPPRRICCGRGRRA